MSEHTVGTLIIEVHIMEYNVYIMEYDVYIMACRYNEKRRTKTK